MQRAGRLQDRQPGEPDQFQYTLEDADEVELEHGLEAARQAEHAVELTMPRATSRQAAWQARLMWTAARLRAEHLPQAMMIHFTTLSASGRYDDFHAAQPVPCGAGGGATTINSRQSR